jgi:Spy/CpxP family protein refolding chaperone
MKKTIIIMFCVLVYSAKACAQQNQQTDPMGKAFFPPELVMHNQDAINLTEAQRNSIAKEMQEAQSEFISAQWGLTKETEKLKSIIEKEKPSEQDALDQFEKIVTMENKIKRRQIILLIRIKNLLNHEQQEKLQRIKTNEQ